MSRHLITVELTWYDGETWGSVWRCTPDGERLRWEGFKRLDAALLRSSAVHSVTTVLPGDPYLRRAMFTLAVPVTGGDGAQAIATTVADQGAG